MKIKIRLPLVSIGFGAIVSIGLASTISGSLAWWAYSTRTSIGYQGTSVASSEQLQVGIKTDINLSAFGLSNDTTPGYYFCNAGTGLQADVINYFLKMEGKYATNELIPITSGSYETGADLELKTNIVSGVPFSDFPAETGKYVHIPLAFRVLRYDNSHNLVPSKGENIWLSEAVAEASSVYDGEVYKAIRMYTVGDVASTSGDVTTFTTAKRLINPSSTSDVIDQTAVAGILDISGSGFYDTYEYENENYAIVYGETNKTDEELRALESIQQDPEESSGIIDINNTGNETELSTFTAKYFMGTWHPASIAELSPKYQNFDTLKTVQAIDSNSGVLSGGKPLCATNLTNGIAELDLTVWLEGWDHHVIDKENQHSFNLGLQFMISR